jgi:hypothetical protein
LYLPIDRAEQLPAAEAVIAALYDVADALGSLEQQQLVDSAISAALIADRLAAPRVAQHAVDALKAAAEQPGEGQGLTAAALDVLASQPAWPACLQPLLLPVVQRASCCDASLADLAANKAADTGSRVQRMLLAVLGDLEAVWRDEQLQKLLLLPLPALQLLISSDQLRVTSEDTVLYTASRFVAAQAHSVAPDLRLVLAPLIRAPHLSGTMLSAQAHSSHSPHMQLGSYSTQIKQLISYRLATSSTEVTAYALDHIAGAPAAWKLSKRQIIASDGVRLVWRVPVEQVAQACRDSFAGTLDVAISCADGSPPLGGVSWSLRVGCYPLAGANAAQGTAVGLYAVAHEPQLMLGLDTLLVFQCRISFHGITHVLACQGHHVGVGREFFTFDMSAGGGWDEAAWAAKGLPTSGELEVTLHMLSVGA